MIRYHTLNDDSMYNAADGDYVRWAHMAEMMRTLRKFYLDCMTDADAELSGRETATELADRFPWLRDDET